VTRILDRPFFILEYKDGVFVRKLPAGARDLGGGLFRDGDAVWRLPEFPSPGPHPLAEKIIGGKALLSLLKSRDRSLIISGPAPAEGEDRLMELALILPAPGKNAARIEIRGPGGNSLPLDDLPRYRYRRGAVYEIMDGETIDELLAGWGDGAGAAGAASADSAGPAGEPGAAEIRGRLILRGEDIPRFCHTRRRLIALFGDKKLREFFSEESVFIPPSSISFVYTAESVPAQAGNAGSARAFPSLKCENRLYPAAEVSALMDREFILLEDKWARREDLKNAGLLPLGYYAGGLPLQSWKPDASGIILREGNGPAGVLPFEWKTELWKDKGESEKIFRAHINFLLAFGFSGGIAAGRHKEQAELLAILAREFSGAGKMLILTEKIYFELYLAALNEFKNPLPAVSTAFYEDLPENGPVRSCGILVLVEPEEAEAVVPPGAFASIKAGVVLGIFSSPFEGRRLKGGLRNILGLRDERLDRYLVRKLNAPLPLPEPAARPPATRPRILRPPRLPGGKTVRFSDEVKFKKLPAADLLTELARINDAGKKSPFVLVRTPRRDPSFDSLKEDEVNYFLYWRGEFRSGRKRKTCEEYIRLYARELILVMDGGESGRAFGGLLSLWTAYREDFPAIDAYLPAWIFDFAALYGIEDPLPLILSRAPAGIESSNILADLYMHRRFIGENNAVKFEDIRLLAPPPLPEKSGQETAAALNVIDRFLRENFRMNFFEFFYPPSPRRENIEAFRGLGGAGLSSYTAEWVSFSGHKPLAEFLETLKNHVEYKLNIKAGINRKPLSEPWRSIVDEPPSRLRPREVPISRQSARPGRIEELRKESDEVRDLLAQLPAPLNTPLNAPPVQPPRGSGAAPARPSPPAPRKTFSFSSFFSALSETEKKALAVIRRKKKADFEAFARQNGAMPDLVIDGINARFGEFSGDLLVNTMDEGPEIQAEYREELDRLLADNTEPHERNS
jgi:hypothetical protein